MRLTLLFFLPALAAAQSTLTLSGCHVHGDGVEYCLLPNGSETPYTTRTSSTGSTPSIPPAIITTTSGPVASPTASAITEFKKCHSHGNEGQFCSAGDEEYKVISGGSDSATSYTDCHNHDSEWHCSGNGLDVTLAAATAGPDHDHEGEGHDHASESTVDISALPAGVTCHEHAGIPHCVDAQGNTVELGCTRPDNDYNIPLRVGLLFVLLVGSALGVFLPILTARFSKFNHDHIVLIAIRQFGTGVIISTAIVHLFTHAQIYFSNECLRGVQYEATAGAILMAGLFVTFLIEYISKRVFGAHHHHSHDPQPPSTPPSELSKTAHTDPQPIASEHDPNNTTQPTSTLNVNLVEAGIIFHSILVGLTLVVTSNTTFTTLSIIILFHQIFEGLALGARISLLPPKISFLHRAILALAFAITTPLGMAIGIGVLGNFNGNDGATIVAIGTLNAFSAGILLWVGVVEMWFEEWFLGSLSTATGWRVVVGGGSLVSGLVVMSVLGKWA